MANTYTRLLYHIVFAPRRREPLIQPKFEERLHQYLGGIIRSEQGTLLAAGGMPDHIHLVVELGATGSLADLLRIIKSKSAGWMNQREDYPAKFYWQRGYAAFTVSQSQLDKVLNYVHRQKEHHSRRGYEAELRQLLHNHEVPFEERYLAD